MTAKKLFPILVFALSVLWLGSRTRGDDSGLSEMDPDIAKEYAAKLTEQLHKEHKDLPVKIDPDAEKAVGLTNADTNEGILLVPLKGFREESEGPKETEGGRGLGLCYIFSSPSYVPAVDGKPADPKKLRTMKFKDGEGNEHETVCLVCAVKHGQGDDWNLLVYGAGKEPLSKSSFEEATDAPKADLALTIKDASANKATLVINLFGKYCVAIPMSHKK
jgi:hypothetical protein